MSKADDLAKETVLQKIRRRQQQVRKEQAEGGDDFNIPEWLDAFPTLNGYLCEDTKSGSKRKGATITLWVTHDGLHCVLNDRDLNVKAFFVSHALNSLWADIDAFLTSEDPDWRTAAGTKRGRS